MTTPESAPVSAATLPLAEWRPIPQVTAAASDVATPAAPVIDAHNHLGRWLSDDGDWIIPDVAALVDEMDAHRIETIVNLDGLWDDEVTANLDRYDRAYPGRFLTFCQLDWELLARSDGEALLLDSLRASAAAGARGVKVWKTLGLKARNADGSLVSPDDPRVIRVLAEAGELGLPVLIHVADPKAFFEPLDARNERLDELGEEPDWWFGDQARYPTFDRLMTALETLVIATPGTTYIGAHVGCVAEDLDRVSRLLSAAPNWNVDIGGRMAELGRQPRRFARLVAEFGDRVVFGTDIYPITGEQWRLHFRFLETADESFSYAPEDPIPPQGRWTVSGIALAPDQLERVYAGNARRILGV